MTNHTAQTLEMVEEQLDRDYRIRTHSFELLEALQRLVNSIRINKTLDIIHQYVVPFESIEIDLEHAEQLISKIEE